MTATVRRKTREKGTTLIELVVVVSIFGLLMTLVYGVLGQVERQTSSTRNRADSVDQARMGLAQIDRHVRSGNVLYDPTAEPASVPLSMRVFTQANGEQRCIQWQVLNGTLRFRSWTSNGLSYSNVAAWSTIARGLVNTSSSHPFQLDPAARYGQRLLNVRLLVRAPGDAANAPVEVQSSLSGRNSQYGYDPASCDPMPPA